MWRACSFACLIAVVVCATAAAQQPRIKARGQVAIPALPGATTAPPALPMPQLPAGTVGLQDDKKDDKSQPPTPNLNQKGNKISPEDFKKYTRLESRERIFSIPDDATLERYVRMKHLEDNPKADMTDFKFPIEPEIGGGKPFVSNTANYLPMNVEYYSLYVVHRRLHFEDKNTERYGWDLGIVQPFVSAATFYKDVFLWPQSLASGCAYGFWDTNAGKCLPGSPTPYMLYPPGLTITGTTFEGVVMTGLAFAIP